MSSFWGEAEGSYIRIRKHAKQQETPKFDFFFQILLNELCILCRWKREKDSIETRGWFFLPFSLYLYQICWTKPYLNEKNMKIIKLCYFSAKKYLRATQKTCRVLHRLIRNFGILLRKDVRMFVSFNIFDNLFCSLVIATRK